MCEPSGVSANIFIDTGRGGVNSSFEPFYKYQGRESGEFYNIEGENGCCAADFPRGLWSYQRGAAPSWLNWVIPSEGTVKENDLSTDSSCGFCHISPSRAADLCLLIHDVCPAAHSADPLPDLLPGVSQYVVKKHTGGWGNILLLMFMLTEKSIWSLVYGPFSTSSFMSLQPRLFVLARVRSLTTTGANGTTLSFSLQFRGSWKDTTATSDQISMVRSNIRGSELHVLMKQLKLTKCWPSLFFIEGPVEIGMSLDIASIDAISEINMVNNLWLDSSVSEQNKYRNLSLFLFRITLQPSSSVSAGVIPGWCSREMRASVWTGAWCHCSGSLTPSSQTPNAPSCMMSP